MKLDKILAVSGLPGLFTLVAERKGGIIIEEIASKKRQFAPSRKYQFAPLQSMAIYTDDGEAEPLEKVFTRMLEQLADNPVPAVNAEKAVHFDYLADVLPNYDRERVHAGDVKKLLKWYHYLANNGGFETEDAEEEETSPNTGASSSEPTATSEEE